jgi:hypothetical protein
MNSKVQQQKQERNMREIHKSVDLLPSLREDHRQLQQNYR